MKEAEEREGGLEISLRELDETGTNPTMVNGHGGVIAPVIEFSSLDSAVFAPPE